MPQDALYDALRSIIRPIITDALSDAVRTATPKAPKKYYTRLEVQERLNIKKTAFYDYVKRGKIKLLKFEGKTLVDADELEAAIKEKEVFRYKHS